jgi:hypothetical protein
MPTFARGEHVIHPSTGREGMILGQASACDCEGCLTYTVQFDDGMNSEVDHAFLLSRGSFAPAHMQRQTIDTLRRGQAYHIISGPAMGHILLVRNVYDNFLNSNTVSGVLYTVEGINVRNSYEVRPSHLGGLATLPATMLPPELRMPTIDDHRWNEGSNTGPEDDCACVACTQHECADECHDYGCDQISEDDCLRRQIRPWNYSPPLTFHGKGPLYLGCELELQTRSGSRNRAAIDIVTEHLGGKVIIKGDGSIEEEGIELALHPMDYPWMQENLPVTPMFKELRELGVRPHVSCGMHVHLSRKGFSSPSHIYKWQKLFYRNVPQMTVLSRREPDRLDRWATFGDTYHRQWSKHFAKGAIGGQRYVALNMNNAQTVEMRIFASTLNAQRFWGSLALADASVEYTRGLSSKDIIKEKAWDFSAFRAYVFSMDKYKPLQREIVRLSL